MDNIAPSELKTILHSKRANIYYLEHCRVLVKGGRVEYVTERSKESLYWNIPIANTTSVLLGTGTSITQAAVRELAKAGHLFLEGKIEEFALILVHGSELAAKEFPHCERWYAVDQVFSRQFHAFAMISM